MKIDNLMNSFENQDWKNLYEKDNTQSAINVVEQSYMMTDREFWRKYRMYIDTDIQNIIEIRRDYRNILLKFYNEESHKIESGDLKKGFIDYIKEFYLSQDPKNISQLGKNYLISEYKENLINEMMSMEKVVFPQSIQEMADEAADINTSMLINHAEDNSSRINYEFDQTLQIFNSDQNSYDHDIIEKIHHYTDKQMFMNLYKSAQGEDFSEKVNLTEKEKNLVLEIGERYFGLVKRRELYRKLGETTNKVLTVRTFETKMFQSLSFFEFLSKIRSISPSSDHNEINKQFIYLYNKVTNFNSPLIQNFINKWKLKPLLDSKNMSEFSIHNLTEILEEKISSEQSGKEMLDIYLSRNNDIKEGSDVLINLYQENSSSANSNMLQKINLFEFLGDLENLIRKINNIICDPSIISIVVDNLSLPKSDQSFKFLSMAEMLMMMDVKKIDISQNELKKNLIKSLNDNFEDLDEYRVLTDEHFNIHRVLSHRDKEEKILDIKRRVLNLYLMKKRIQNKISIMEKDFKDMKTELVIKKNTLESKNNLSVSEIQELDTLRKLLADFSLENAVKYPLEFLYGIDKFKNLFQEQSWIEEYELWRNSREGKFFFTEIEGYGSHREIKENKILNTIGPVKYLLQEIGVINFFKNPSDYRRIEIELQSRISTTISPIDVAEAILTELSNKKAFSNYLKNNINPENSESTSSETSDNINKKSKSSKKKALKGVVENDTNSNDIKLKREFQLLNMKIKIIEEEFKDTFLDEKIKKNNQMIRLEKYISDMGEQGQFVSKENYKFLLEKFDISENHSKEQYLKTPLQTSNIFLEYFIDNERKHIMAKSRLLTDYLIRFDPDFRRKFLRNKTIKEMSKNFVPEEKKKANAARLITSDIVPSYFSSNNKSVLVRLMENYIQSEMPNEFMLQDNLSGLDNLEKYLDNNVEKIAIFIENKVINEILNERKDKQSVELSELQYSKNLKNWMNNNKAISNEESEIIYNLFNPAINNTNTELPLIKGNWTSNPEKISKNELISALKSPSFKNEGLISDFILSSLQNINNLESNDPKLIEFVNSIYTAKQERINKFGNNVFREPVLNQVDTNIISELFDGNSSDILFTEKNLSKKNILTEEQIKELVNNEKGEEIEKMITDSQEILVMNEKLLQIIETLDLQEIGIDESFKNSLKELIDTKKSEIIKKKKEIELYNLPKDDFLKETHLPLEQLEDNQLTMSNLKTIDRTKQNTMFAEQLVMVGMHDDLYSSMDFVRNGINEDYFKFTKYSFDNLSNLVIENEYMLSNDGVFNIHQESENDRAIIDELYHPVSFNPLLMHRIGKIPSKEQRDEINEYMDRSYSQYTFAKRKELTKEINKTVRDRIICAKSDPILSNLEYPEPNIPANLLSKKNIDKFINIYAQHSGLQLRDDKATRIIFKNILKKHYIDHYQYSNINDINEILNELNLEEDSMFMLKKLPYVKTQIDSEYLEGKISKEEYDGKFIYFI